MPFPVLFPFLLLFIFLLLFPLLFPFDHPSAPSLSPALHLPFVLLLLLYLPSRQFPPVQHPKHRQTFHTSQQQRPRSKNIPHYTTRLSDRQLVNGIASSIQAECRVVLVTDVEAVVTAAADVAGVSRTKSGVSAWMEERE